MLSFSTERDEEHDDVSLIQKANLVLKTAGLNASVISIQQLQFTIPVIVVKVFESFFGHKLNGINYSPSNRYDHENNTDIVVQSLQSRYQYEALDGITGASLVKGDRHAVEVIIDVFYGISQKIINQSEKMLAKSSSPDLVTSQQSSPPKDPAIPGELKVLMNRVAYLEDKLNEGDENEIQKKKKKRKKKGIKHRASDTGDILDPTTHERVDLSPRLPNKGPQKSLTRRRPTSAPAGGRRKQAELEVTPMPVAEGKVLPNKGLAKDNSDLSPKKKTESEEHFRLYTYDTWTGRRVLRSELDYLTAQRRKKFLQMGITPPEYLHDGGMGAHDNDGEDGNKRKVINRGETWTAPSPTKAEYPGRRTEQSVEEYIQKMQKIRKPEDNDPYSHLDQAKMFNSYRHMNPLDIVISIEHCHSCEQHPMTLRHKTHEYVKHADEVMRHLAMAAHSAHPCARVGVIRFNAHITPSPRNPDAHLRIGAFEVQVAYKDHRGQVLPELLHSKLKTRRWPSKTVLEKRIMAFFAKTGVQTHKEAAGRSYEGTGEDGIAPYPIGVGEWSEVPLSETTWKYIPPAGARKTLAESIQWAFDARAFAHYPQFAVGTTVRVYSAPNDWDGVEKFSCVGVVKRAFKDEATNTDMVSVKLRYHDTETECPSSNCESMNQEDQCPAPTTLEYEFGVPRALVVVLKFGASENLIDWKLRSPEDHILYRQGRDEIHLCRASFYHQMRCLTWSAINSRPGSTNGFMAEITSDGDEEDVDAQLAYSEPVLDWAINKFGKLINTNELMKLIQLPPQSAKGGKTPNAWSTKSESFAGSGSFGDNDDPMDTLRKRIQTACLTLAPPPNSSQTPQEGSLESSIYKPGAQLIFERFDEEKSGTLDRNHFSRALDSFGIEYSKQELEKLWVLLDLDGDSFISLPELLSFLQFTSGIGYKELGEIWELIRDVSRKTRGSGEQSVLEEMEKDMFSMCTVQDGVGTVIPTDIFKKVLKKFGIFEVLRPGDMKILVAYHGVDVHGKPVSESVLKSRGTDIDLKKYLIKFDDFFSWLQPVDFVSLCKKISTALQSNGGEDSLQHVLILSGAHTVGPSDFSPKEVFIKHGEIAMQTNVDIIVTPENGLSGTFEFKTSRVDAHTISLKSTCSNNSEYTGWSEDLIVRWEIYGPEKSVEGIPLSAVDPDNLGYVAKSNFKRYVESIGIVLSDAEVRSLYRNFGQEDGNTMTFEQLHRLVTTHTATHRFVPLIGSRAYRKKSIVGGAGLFVSGESTEPTATAEDVYVEDFVDDGQILEADAAMALAISQIELTGNALQSKSLSKFIVEIKYLLQEFSVEVTPKHKRGTHKRVLDDLEWDAVLLTASSLKMNADISFAIKTTDSEPSVVVATAYFSPSQILKDVEGPHSISLRLSCEDYGDLSALLTCRVRETTSSRSARIKRMQTEDLLAVSFHHSSDDYGRDEYEIDNEDDAGPEYLADFVTTDEEVLPVIEVAKDVDASVVSGERIAVNEDSMYMVHIRQVSAVDLLNVEMFGKNDPYIVLRVGSLWSFHTSTLEDAGAAAMWRYHADDSNVVFEAKGSQLLAVPLSVEVFDHNHIKNDELIGKGEGFISSSGDITISLLSRNDFGKEAYAGTVTISVSFKVDKYEEDLLLVSGKQQFHFPFVHFTLDDIDSKKRHSHVVLSLQDWVYESAVVVRTEGSCSWDTSDAVGSCDASALRKDMLEVKVYVKSKNGTKLVGHGTASVRNLLVDSSSASHPIQFGVDIINDKADKIGRVVVGGFVEGRDQGALSLISPSSADDLHEETDKDVLLDFFHATGGGNAWYDTCFWSKDVELSGWLNIDLDSDGSRVTGIRIGSNGLTGQIPRTLYKLEMLTELELFGNGLSGNIPSEIGELVHLRTLLLNHNSLTGPIPISLSRCITLEELDLSNNQLSGIIPEEIAIPRLTTVNLSSNQFEGFVPISFTQCKLLKNFLCDLIPYEDDEFYKTFDWIKAHSEILLVDSVIKKNYDEAIRQHKKHLLLFSQDVECDEDRFLEWLDGEDISMWPGVKVDSSGRLRSLKLSNASLRGMLPTRIELLSTIVFLDLSNNALEGFIPDEITNILNLKFLYLNSNSFEGSLPADLHQLVHLKTLHVGENQLSGELPTSWLSFKHLEVLNLSANEFEGPLPQEIFALEGLRQLDLSGNSLSGEIPDLSSMVALESLGLAKNKLRGTIPDSIGHARALRDLDVSFTPLTGKLPTSLQNLSHLEEMKIQMTNLDLGDLDAQTAKTVIIKRMPSLRKVSL